MPRAWYEYKTRSQIFRALPSSLIEEIIADWIEAYEGGWRPHIMVVGRPEELYDELRAIKDAVEHL